MFVTLASASVTHQYVFSVSFVYFHVFPSVPSEFSKKRLGQQRRLYPTPNRAKLAISVFIQRLFGNARRFSADPVNLS